MKTFTPLAFDPVRAHKEVLELRDLLAANPVLEEHRDLFPFFRSRPHLSALCGRYDLQVQHFDRVAWEYELFGDFSCDLVVGDSVTKDYCFIEFEDAGPRSLFVPQAQSPTPRARRLARGFIDVAPRAPATGARRAIAIKPRVSPRARG